MPKIKVSTVTELIFDSEDFFKEYLESDVQAKITGFSGEIKKAWQGGKQLTVETARPNIGAVATTYITALILD